MFRTIIAVAVAVAGLVPGTVGIVNPKYVYQGDGSNPSKLGPAYKVEMRNIMNKYAAPSTTPIHTLYSTHSHAL
jgi:hypothetical protein